MVHGISQDKQEFSTTVYGSAAAAAGLSRYEMAEEEMPARNAYRFIKDELELDGRPGLNLASFVTTYMEPEAESLMTESLNKNFIDVEEYPACGEIEKRCVNMIGNLFNAPMEQGDDHDALGVSTVGSSEAIILAVLAAKKRWQAARKAAGKSTESPNVVMNSAVQVCWEKATRYLDVEEKYVYCTETRFVMDPKEAIDLVDENTILVCAILGTTYTGQYEDVLGMSELLEKKNKEIGTDVYIHVDAASGGFCAPFVTPDLLWDFRVPMVCSINTSGHKYGLAYAGVGFAFWRSREFLPESILFSVDYLGSAQISFTLNFSKSAVQVIGQYYQLLRFGKSGYRAVMQNLTATASYLAKAIENMDGGKRFELMSDEPGKGLPLVAWRLKDKNSKFDEFAIAHQLRERGWIVPAYHMAPHAHEVKMLRVVCREDFSRDKCNSLIRDINDAVKTLDKTPQAVLDHAQNEKKEQHQKKSGHHMKKGHHNTGDLKSKHGKSNAIC